jgi:hypothetical protein
MGKGSITLWDRIKGILYDLIIILLHIAKGFIIAIAIFFAIWGIRWVYQLTVNQVVSSNEPISFILKNYDAWLWVCLLIGTQVLSFLDYINDRFNNRKRKIRRKTKESTLL